ncbi:MAG: hypothetical protein AB7W37_08610 [Syntrophobacteraceae bacterium]
MVETQEQAVQVYRKRVSELYESVRNWAHDASLQTTEETVELNEEAYGHYEAPKLSVKTADGKIIAELVPMGASIIGSEGRVDVVGKYDKAIVVYVAEGPALTTVITCGDQKETHVTKFYRGIKGAGWYYVEDRRRGKAYEVDKEMLYELLGEVSDYEIV